ncbi:RHS repeat-associated core domain-containing protein [Mesorhizobium sp. VK24D]|uniref:RHS repeat-associated core domain-containing protein n=1 Tax=Mesorhizobium album TaxID=3072314 RepID=A0ABU4Y573_9HYPH|nr:RHS repeat-associated core domain-containing protein [Mesorhizobium sp. VK24D]MDX8482085.1 RHS repeat-associated core domain-containing protein [Mesorhizobium sp. VK24D]
MFAKTFATLVALTAGTALLGCPARAADKSATSIVQLPAAGGTVTQEEGSFALNNNTGSANFTLPLPTLPTRGQFGPQLSLTYSQFAGDTGNGLGIGWQFNTQAIAVNDDLGTAVPGTKPDGDFFSRLSYMGARLVFLGNQNGVWEYKPEYSEDFVKILYHTGPFDVVSLDLTGGPHTDTIPSGFEVTNADGTRLIFSGDPSVAEGNFDSAKPYVTKWPLVLQLNANREAVRYDYQRFGGRSYLTKASFAGGQSSYQFDLIETQSTLVSHTNGSKQANARLYGKVTARFKDTVYAQWCMGYIGRDTGDTSKFVVRAHPDCLAKAQADLTPLIDTQSVNVLDQLRVLYRYGDTGGGALAQSTLKFPDIHFGYSSWTSAELASRPVVFEAPKMAFAGDIPPQNFELADLNMDGLVDIVQTKDDGATVHLGSGDLNSAFGETTQLVLSRPTEAGLMRQIAPRLTDNRFAFADILGDSFVDIVEIEDGLMHVYDGKADGTFPYLGRSIPLPGVSPTTFAGGNGRFADLNMDGLSDIVTTRLNANGRTEWRIFLNLTRREADGGHSVNFGALTKAFPFNSQDGQILGRNNVRLVDINGDRLPDLVVIRPADQGFCLYENQGNIFSTDPNALLFGDAAINDPVCGHGTFSKIGGMQPGDSLTTMWYIDANGDGIIDFASMGQRTDQMRIWLGFGDGTYLKDPLTIALNLRVQVGTSTQTFASRVADIDGDGQDEIIVFQKPSGDEVKPVVVIDFNRTDTMQLVKANLLTVVDFDSGRRHDIRYATSIDEMLRDRANGQPTRNLHFPVVVAKQLVTSQGIPGQVRAQVQTDEFFYHNPFYDVINRRFIGFSEVEKVAYGDENTTGQRVTQRSSLDREQYYTFAETAADLNLAGKLKIRKTYEVKPEATLVASAETTETLDPSAAALHSLSTATRSQKLPTTGMMLKCESTVWEAFSRGDGSSYLRKVKETLTESAGEAEQQDAADPECKDPVKTQTYAGFDEFNMPASETVRVRSIPGPEGLTVPGFSRTTQTDYVQSRADLAALGIVNAASERRILAGTRLLSRENFTYLPDSGGRMGSRTLEVLSGLGALPPALEPFRNASRKLAKTMAYDVFGNTISMSDDLGQTEGVTYEATGTLPLSHVRMAGGAPELNQVTSMTYDGPRVGAVRTMTTPLGMVVTNDYDALGRRIHEAAADGAEKFYNYKIGEGGLPSLILTSKRRYKSAAETPEGESEFIAELAAYNARGDQIADLENVAEGGVRVINFSLYNRNQKQIFRWTPFVVKSFGGVDDLNLQKVFDLGDIPRPDHEIGNAYTYDAAGRMVRETHPSGKVSDMTFGPWGTHTVTTYNDQFDGIVHSGEYSLKNENGVTAFIASDGAGTTHVSRFVRDSFGYLSEIWLPGETTPRRLIYNSVGDIELQSTPAMGDRYSFYDSRGRLSTIARIGSNGETSVQTFTYDFLNRKLTEVNDGVLHLEYRYDRGVQVASAAGFETPITLPLDKTTAVVIHDPNGKFDAVQRYAYNANGRMVANEVEIAGAKYADHFHHTLDGRIDASEGPRGLASRFALGPDKNLRSVTVSHPDFAGPQKVIENITYNPEGRVARIDYRLGAFTQMTYDPATLFLTHIVSRAGSPLQDLTMTFNSNGSITQIVDALAGSAGNDGHVDRSGTFHYNFKNELVRMDRYGQQAEFAYSPAGTFARNDELDPGATMMASSAASVTGLVPAGTAAKPYAFDGFAQLAKSPTLTGTVFDINGRLIRAQTATNEVFYGYDQTGRRLYKKVVSVDGSAPEQLYLYPVETFEIGPKGDESYVNVADSKLVRLEHGTGKWFYYLKDHIESSDYVIASDGTPVEQMLYKAYGTEHKPESLAPAWATHLTDAAAALPREKTHHRFTGKYLDDDTGLYYYGARYYDPALGRFISPDPLYVGDPERCTGNPTSCNLFAYANNNPMAYIDPTGLKEIVAGDAAYRRQVEEDLQRTDPTARVDSKTGEVSQSFLHGVWLDIKNFFVPGTGMDTGRDLTRRVIDDPQTTTIQNEAGVTAARNKDPTVNPQTTAGDVIIGYDPATARTRTSVEFDKSTGTTASNPADPGIVLAHEQIHASHRMAGQHSGRAPATYTSVDGKSYTSPNEEARTIGVGGTSRPDDITENQLRDMLGIKPRVHW